jgi:predicted cupin superfamily sugar epimerase
MEVMTTSARQIIEKLGLAPHPEGGWYRETWRAPAAGGARGAGTSILFLLEAGQRSHWHRIDATELWLFQGGGPLRLETARAGVVTEYGLGPNTLAGDLLQARVEPHEWQSAEALDGWSLVACVVMPAFDFARFELAPPGWDPRGLVL